LKGTRAGLGAHARADLRGELRPGLKTRGYVTGGDDSVLEKWLDTRVRNRPALLRPGLRHHSFRPPPKRFSKKSTIWASVHRHLGYSSARLIEGLELTNRIGALARCPLHGSGTWCSFRGTSDWTPTTRWQGCVRPFLQSTQIRQRAISSSRSSEMDKPLEHMSGRRRSPTGPD
jgi:hypothetical protein